MTTALIAARSVIAVMFTDTRSLTLVNIYIETTLLVEISTNCTLIYMYTSPSEHCSPVHPAWHRHVSGAPQICGSLQPSQIAVTKNTCSILHVYRGTCSMCMYGHTQALVSFSLIPMAACDHITEHRTSLIHNSCVGPTHTYINIPCTLYATVRGLEHNHAALHVYSYFLLHTCSTAKPNIWSSY